MDRTGASQPIAASRVRPNYITMFDIADFRWNKWSPVLGMNRGPVTDPGGVLGPQFDFCSVLLARRRHIIRRISDRPATPLRRSKNCQNYGLIFALDLDPAIIAQSINL